MEALVNPQWKGWSDPFQSFMAASHAITDPAGRIAAAGLNLNPAIGGADLTVSGLNALKAVASRYAPSLRNTPDIPTVSGLASSAAGVTPLAPDASPVQRYAEAAATGLVNPKQAVRTGLEMVGATGGGDAGSSIASYYGGPDWSQFGRWFGSLGGAATAAKLNPVDLARWPASARASAKAPLTSAPPKTRCSRRSARWRTLSVAESKGVSASCRASISRSSGRSSGWRKVSRRRMTTPPRSSIRDSRRRPTSTRSARTSFRRRGRSPPRSRRTPRNSSRTSTISFRRATARWSTDTPVLNAIEAQANSPNVSGQQKADLMDRYNYLKSMTYGQPGYNGPRFQGVTPVNAIPIGQIAKFRSELGDDLNTMRGIDATAQGPARDAVTAAMQNTFTQVEPRPAIQRRQHQLFPQHRSRHADGNPRLDRRQADQGQAGALSGRHG